MNRAIALCATGVAALVLVVAAPEAFATVRVPALIGDHMMVQRGRPVRLWGTAAPGESVRAALAGGKATTQALQALKLVYGKEVLASGPVFHNMVREAGAIRVSFANATSGLLTVDGASPKGFMLAGADHVWQWADASIDGDSVIVARPEVREPVAVRYGWANDPPNTLRNQADLPAAPFRTDDWPARSSASRPQ